MIGRQLTLEAAIQSLSATDTYYSSVIKSENSEEELELALHRAIAK
jgi:hypothetical protein